MHTAHALQTHPEHHDLQQLHPHQHQQQQHPQIQHQNEPLETTMTVLETLNPSQPLAEQQPQQVMGMIDPVQQHAVQHLVQPTNQQQPHLHQLQPSHNPLASLDSTSSQGDGQQQVGQHQHSVAQQADSNQQRQNPTSKVIVNGNNLLRKRPQNEGIITDGGGPIVQWLLDNFEIAEGESLPRSTVYNLYLAHCRRLQIASVNAASFGKLIRSVFVGLKTRRLGTRGHSKYHYFGVRAKPHIQQELLQHEEAGCSRDLANNENSNQNTDNGSDSDSTGNGIDCGRLSSSGSTKRIRRDPHSQTHRKIYHHHNHQNPPRQQEALHTDHQHQQQPQQIELDTNGVYYNADNGTNGYNGSISKSADHLVGLEQSHYELADFRNHLGANWTTLVDEHWPQREDCHLERQLIKATGSNELANCLKIFEAKYKLCYKRMVELLSELKFLEVERLWRDFWSPNQQNDHWQSSLPEHAALNGTDQSQQQQQSNDNIIQEPHLNYQPSQQQQQHHHQQQSIRLDFHYLYQLTSQSVVAERINQIDNNLYKAIESFLLPDMLSPIPALLAQQIRQFAENICPWIELSVKDYDPNFVAQKSQAARAFGSTLRRYESLNRLSTASRAIWEKRSSLTQMSLDLSRIDLRDIEHQIAMMSQTYGDVARTNSLGPTNNQLTSSMNSPLINQTVTSNMNPTQQQTTDSNNENNLLELHHHTHHLCTMQPGQLIQNFLHLLEDPYPANSWPDWCRNLVESRICGPSVDEANNFVLKWHLYISLIMKELTLRSAPSFASFLLIKSLFDEYIFYLIEPRLAEAQHKKPELNC